MEFYQTIAKKSTGRLVEKKSEFIAVAAPVISEEEALAVLEEVKASHRGARHNVYAYCLQEGNRQRYSDDGEPAKTAGLPVLGCITHAELTNCIIVVTRYFGGTLLGTGGLVRAYSGAANAALEQAEIVTVRLCVHLTIQLAYSLYEQACRLLEAEGARLGQVEFTHLVTIPATQIAGKEEASIVKLQELSRGDAEIEVSDPFYQPF